MVLSYGPTQRLSELSNLDQIASSFIFRILRIEDKDGNPIYEYPLRIPSIPHKEEFEISNGILMKIDTECVLNIYSLPIVIYVHSLCRFV